MDLQELETAYAKWLHFDQDPLLVRTLYSIVLANRFDSDPVWALLVAPPASGKTELLSSLAGSETALLVSTLTPNALASGFGDGSDSLLFQLDGRMLIVEDMSAITELNADARNTLFSFLRSAYGGHFTKSTGRGTIEWHGKFGMLGGATLAIESAKKMDGSLGERFLTVRPKVNWLDQDAMLDRVMGSSTHKANMRGELKQAAASYLSQSFDFTNRKIRAGTISMLKQAAIALSRLRTVAVRDHFTREISFPLEVNEMGARLFTQFLVIALAAHSMGIDWDDVEKIVMRVMLDSVPYARTKILREIFNGMNEPRTLQPAMNMSQATVGRHLEELKLLKIVTMSKNRRLEIAEPVIELALASEGP